MACSSKMDLCYLLCIKYLSVLSHKVVHHTLNHWRSLVGKRWGANLVSGRKLCSYRLVILNEEGPCAWAWYSLWKIIMEFSSPPRKVHVCAEYCQMLYDACKDSRYQGISIGMLWEYSISCKNIHQLTGYHGLS